MLHIYIYVCVCTRIYRYISAICIIYIYIYIIMCVWCLQCGIIMKQLIHFEHVRITPIHWSLFWSCRDWRRLGGTPVQRQQQNFHRGWGPIQEHSAVVDSSVDSTSTESEIYEIDKGFQRLRCPSLIYNIYIYMSRDPHTPPPPARWFPPPVAGEGGFSQQPSRLLLEEWFLGRHVYIYIYICTIYIYIRVQYVQCKRNMW